MINTAIYDLFKTGKIKDSYILELIRNTIVNGKTLPKTAISFGKITNDANATTYGIFIMPVTDNTENVECVVYLDKNDHWWIIDFKTNKENDVSKLEAKYKTQLDDYREALLKCVEEVEGSKIYHIDIKSKGDVYGQN